MRITRAELRHTPKEAPSGNWAEYREWQKAKNIKCRIYFFVKDESILENLNERHTRPYKEYRKLFPDLFKRLNLDPALAKRAAWSQHAGCRCPCSPGFIMKNTPELLGATIYVDIGA